MLRKSHRVAHWLEYAIGATNQRRTASYRCTAVWSADSWLSVYGLWAKYRGRHQPAPKGRELLLRAPGS